MTDKKTHATCSMCGGTGAIRPPMGCSGVSLMPLGGGYRCNDGLECARRYRRMQRHRTYGGSQ